MMLAVQNILMVAKKLNNHDQAIKIINFMFEMRIRTGSECNTETEENAATMRSKTQKDARSVQIYSKLTLQLTQEILLLLFIISSLVILITEHVS